MSSRPVTGEDILALARIFGATTGVGWREIGRAIGAPGVLNKIEAAVPVSASVLDRALNYFAHRWPDSLAVPWPLAIPRPKTERYTPRPGPEAYRQRRA